MRRSADALPRFASLAHAHGLAAAVISDAPVGVDVEWLGRPRLRAARESAGRDELRLLGDDDASALVLLWTGKEAVLKQVGVGLSRLSRCRLLECAAPSEASRELVLGLDGVRHRVVSRALPAHWLSVASEHVVRFHELEALEALEAKEPA